MNKHIEKLVKLSKENPEMEIIAMTNYEVCASDDFTYWKGFIKSVEIEEYCENISYDVYGMVFGKDDIIDHIIFINQEWTELELPNDVLELRANAEYEKYKKENKVKKSIIIRIDV